MPGDTTGTGTPVEGAPGQSMGEVPMTVETTPAAAPPVEAAPEETPQVVPSTPPTSGQQASTAEEYEKLLEEQRAIQSGNQKQINALTAQVGALMHERDSLKSQIAEMQEKTVEASSDEVVDLRQKLENLENEKAALEQALTGKDREIDRITLAASEYPSLAGPLLKAKALPSAEDDTEFRAAMDNLLSSMSSQAEALYQAQVAGARPAVAPESEPLPDSKTLLAEIRQATKDGDKARLEELQGQWYEIYGDDMPTP